MNKNHSNEFAFIQKFLHSNYKIPDNVIGIGDDTALLPAKLFKKKDLIITSDSMSDNIHFRRDWCSGDDIAFKLIEMNASDIIAKGGTPEYALLSMQIPNNLFHSDFIERFQKRFKKHLRKKQIHLIGGDTTSGDSLDLTVTMLGRTKKFIPRKSKKALKVNDKLYITGIPGQSEAGLRLLSKNLTGDKNNKKFLIKKYCRPRACWNFKNVSKHKAIRSSIDQSDSLHESLKILSDENNIEIKVDLSFIDHIEHFHKVKDDEKLSIALSGGEDFNILFFADRKRIDRKFLKQINKHDYFEIGYVKKSGNAAIEYLYNGQIINPADYLQSYKHFN